MEILSHLWMVDRICLFDSVTVGPVLEMLQTRYPRQRDGLHRRERARTARGRRLRRPHGHLRRPERPRHHRCDRHHHRAVRTAMRIVLIRLSALGDIVHTWPLAVAIRAARPRAHLTWIVEEPLAPLVEGHPAVDAVLTVATGRWRKRPFSSRTRAEIAAFKSRVHELQPDLSIDAQGTLKSGLITRWCKAPRRVGLARPWRREAVAGPRLHRNPARKQQPTARHRHQPGARSIRRRRTTGSTDAAGRPLAPRWRSTR